GAIFGFLPIADAVDPDRFRRLFTTPAGCRSADIAAALAGPFGFDHHDVSDVAALGELLARPAAGVRVVTVAVDAAANLDQHRRLAAAVAAAV
ncbi:MAG TPA: 2-succinyl-5-enolpyruvyl-6-hydroxy-3-cyclohexene-1-carboxylate synthase, partial [Acidimicrobiaceae bacterium]|nr:2-succinyl-5-enolpyruvyl-6-hydroxy-3-cyclohexene-1-carboxylate synthase [Acidimicrobiaceae bacterium]